MFAFCLLNLKDTIIMPLCYFLDQLVRRLQGQDGEADGEEAPASPKKIFRLMNQVLL